MSNRRKLRKALFGHSDKTWLFRNKSQRNKRKPGNARRRRAG